MDTETSRILQNVATSVAIAAFSRFLALEIFHLSLCFCLAPRAGFEPATNRLTAGQKPILQKRIFNAGPSAIESVRGINTLGTLKDRVVKMQTTLVASPRNQPPHRLGALDRSFS